MISEFYETPFRVSLDKIATLFMRDLKVSIELPINPGHTRHGTIEGRNYGKANRQVLLASPEAAGGPAIVGSEDYLVPRGDFTPGLYYEPGTGNEPGTGCEPGTGQ